jgi:putative transposase
VASVKDDVFDAFVLADTLRHEHGHWRPLPVPSAVLAELRALTRDRARLDDGVVEGTTSDEQQELAALRVGAAGDNAAMESFFALLQNNVLNRQTWQTRDELRFAIITWIERTYNRRRRQCVLGRLTPSSSKPSSPAPTFKQQHDPHNQPSTEPGAIPLYIVVRSLDPTGRGRRRWMNRWKPALNAFEITFEGRLLPTGE